MEIIRDVLQTIMLEMSAVTLLPIVICALGVIFRMKFSTALKAGLMVGIGFQGLSLVIGLLMTSIDPVTKYYKAMGSGFTTTDLGFAAVGAASFTVPFAVIAIFLIIVLNFVLIRFGLVKVMNIDIWNFIHFLIPGAVTYALFGSAILGCIVTVALSVITLFVSQAIAPKWQEFYGLEGTTCTCFSFITFMYPLSWLINKIVDLIPGVRNVKINLDKLSGKLGLFGDTAFVGLIVGIFLGIITKQSFTTILIMGMGIASVLILIPRMVTIMMEGLTPVGNAANTFVKKWLGEDSELIIGMDIALGLGDPACITCTAICIPITILFAFLIPNMTYFPIGLLGIVCYTTVMCVLASKGDLFRSLICSIASMYIIAFCANLFAPEATLMISVTGLEISGMVTDGFFGFNLANIILSLIYRMLGM